MKIDIWSDIACPWCAVGKRRFERALAEYGEPVDVAWHSFLLDPQAPVDYGISHDELLARKYGRSLEEARAMGARVADEGAKEGLEFRFDRVRMGSTLDAHRLHHLAASVGLGEAMMGRLMRAYLEEGALMGDPETLVRLGTEVGLPECDIRFMLAGDRFKAEVQDDLQTARRLGISSVPFFVLEERYGVAGAQPMETLLKILREVGPATEGETCGPEGCAV